MRSRRIVLSVLCMALALGLSGCTSQSDGPAPQSVPGDAGPVSVYVVNYPLRYFAERIGDGHVAVHFPVPADADPAYWMPDSETISKYQQADVILLNGAGYEKWIDAVSLPKSTLCDTSAAFAADYIALEDAVTHSHGPEGQHAHSETAFTTWLDPILAVKQADAVRAWLAKLRPEKADAFQRNYDALKTDLEDLHRKITEAVAKAPDRPVLFSHPVYQYLERRYGLNAKSVHWEPDEPPTEAMWEELDVLLAKHPAKWMVWEGEPSAKTVGKLTEMGIGSVTFAPCGVAATEGDYLDAQCRSIENLARVFAARK